MKKSFLDILYEFAGAKEALSDARRVKKVDPKTGKTTIEFISNNMKAFKNAQYEKVLQKMKDDPSFKKQAEIIRKNNVFYLNRMYNVIKTKDPNIENLQILFSKTKNDADFFSYMNSFIVPLSSLLQTTAKIESEKIWDDQIYKDLMRKNAFEIEMPKSGVSPTPDNVMIKWGNKKISIRKFNEDVRIIAFDSQKYEDVKDAIEGTKKIKNILKENDIKIKEEIERSDFLDNLSKFISFLKYPKDGKIVVGLEKIKNSNDFKDEAFEELLSGDNTDDIEFIFKNKFIYEDLSSINEKMIILKDVYFKYSDDIKSIIDSPLIESDKNYKRATLGENIKEISEIVNEIKNYGIKFYKLKTLIKEISKKGEIPFDGNVKQILNINAKDLNFLFDRISKMIIKLRSVLRVHGFVDFYQSANFYDLIDIEKIDINDEKIEDYYVMLSIVPEDVRNQSTHQFWTSCQNLLNGQTDLNKWVGSSTLLGNIVAFLLALDWSKPTGGGQIKTVKSITHSAITDPKDIMSIEEFKEEAKKGIQGTKKLAIRKFLRSYAIRPIARVLIKTFDLSPEGVRTLRPESLMQGGSEEEIESMKFVDRLYSPRGENIPMVSRSGEQYGKSASKYSTLFYNSMKSIAKRLNFNVKIGPYRLRDMLYNDGTDSIIYSSVIKKYQLGQEINFSRLKTNELLELLKQDKNFLRYKTFRHALFSKERIEGTLDLQGTTIESLDPMHPTNLPTGPGLSDDKYEDIQKMNNSWMVNDNFIKDEGDFDAPLTKDELKEYQKSHSEASK